MKKSESWTLPNKAYEVVRCMEFAYVYDVHHWEMDKNAAYMD